MSKFEKKARAKREAAALLPSLFGKAREFRKKGEISKFKALSKKISYLKNKHKLNVPLSEKRHTCKNCRCILIPGLNCRVRARDGFLVAYCLECRRYSKLKLSN
ncbi:hypothetical protein HYV84_05750 [Candidatus Woesearchaeota archaeon]|nr:hypothetical protein [Candidatus Woesearchaeota archaeon]